MATTSTNLQDLIDAKRVLIADIIVKITAMNAIILEITASPKPSYEIDGQAVFWNDYLSTLTTGVENLGRLQKIEIDSMNDLISMQIRIEPYHYVSRNV